ncbi:MAG: phosphohexomutase domain-containing protein [Nitrososphaerales archaeon]
MTQTTTSKSAIDQLTGLVKRPIKVKFGTAGIRGTFGQEVSIRETLAVCYAVNGLLGEGRFGLGYDSRKSSFILGTVACAAMNWYGSDVENYGRIPTPVLAFNIKNSKLHAGFSVTASHNPPEYAGVKVFGTDGIEFSLEDEQKLEAMIQKSASFVKYETSAVTYGSTYENEEAIYSYCGAVLKRSLEAKKQFKILVDCANGTSDQVTPNILSALGHKIVTINAHSSHIFPGRMPEPMLETLGEVANVTRSISADFAICHDGDADRLVMITSSGEVVPDYALATLILKIIIERAKRGTVIISLNSSRALEKVATEAGCKVYRSRLGKTFEELYKRRGIYASEPSKIVDPSWGYWEDGIFASIVITQYLSEHGLSLEEALRSIPKYHNLQRNLSVDKVVDYNLVKERVQVKFGEQIDNIEDLDGVKVHLKSNDSWFMIRSSGTERKIRVYVESSNEMEAKSLLEQATKIASA